MMDEESRSRDRAGRRPKRFLTPLHKYEIYPQFVRGEVNMSEAAAAAQVDRSTLLQIRQVAKDGACQRWPSPGRGSIFGDPPRNGRRQIDDRVS
jgi:hypothetical protein